MKFILDHDIQEKKWKIYLKNPFSNNFLYIWDVEKMPTKKKTQTAS